MSGRWPNPDGVWVITGFRSDLDMVTPVSGSEPMIEIDGTKLSGSTGLNRFGGEFDGTLPLGPLATTRMSGPPELMEQENRLLHHLQSAETITVRGDGMSLMKDRLVLVKLQRSKAGWGLDRPSDAAGRGGSQALLFAYS